MVGEHPPQQVEPHGVQLHRVFQVLRAPLWEGVFVFRQLRNTRPQGLVRGSHEPEYVEQLVDFRVSRKERPSVDHFGKYAPDGPHVDWGGVVLCPEQDLRRTVPQRDNLMSVCPNRYAECPRQAKVSQLQNIPLPVDQEVLWLEVPVKDSVRMTVGYPPDHLQQIILHHSVVLVQPRIQVEVFLQVQVKKLKHKVDPVLCMHDVLQADDINMIQFLQ
mmetsp:Transcript_42865/g.101763  ORF Transcript_42865/g.101763 Transcript_42865/m.101763 type:complete len:217 (-) Transcript_42865:452-1102(-)